MPVLRAASQLLACGDPAFSEKGAGGRLVACLGSGPESRVVRTQYERPSLLPEGRPGGEACCDADLSANPEPLWSGQSPRPGPVWRAGWRFAGAAPGPSAREGGPGPRATSGCPLTWVQAGQTGVWR